MADKAPENYVLIEVKEGIPDVTYSTEGIEVEIVDWDCLENGECPICGAELDGDDDWKCPEHGSEEDMATLLWDKWSVEE